MIPNMPELMGRNESRIHFLGKTLPDFGDSFQKLAEVTLINTTNPGLFIPAYKCINSGCSYFSLNGSVSSAFGAVQ
jgi:hypothetical protein